MPSAPYQRVAAEIRRRIASGEWPAGHQLPSQAELARILGVTLPSARRGMSILRRAGELEGSPRARLTVAHPPAVRTLLDPDADWPYPTGDGATGRSQATAELAARLQVPPRTRLSWELTECLDPDFRPSHLVTTWWATSRRAWVRSVSEVELHQLTAAEAGALGLISGVLALRVTRTRYGSDGRPVETADLILPADRWRIRL